MRTSYTLASSLFLLMIGFSTACSGTKQLVETPSKRDSLSIVGDWVVQSFNIGQQVLPASSLGREIRFSFHPDGTTIFTGPSGLLERGKYQVRNNKIYDPENPAAAPIDIVSLNPKQLVIAMIEEENGEAMTMTMVPIREDMMSSK